MEFLLVMEIRLIFPQEGYYSAANPHRIGFLFPLVGQFFPGLGYFAVEQYASIRSGRKVGTALKSEVMLQHWLSRNLLFGGLGLFAGFLALAIAVPIEPQIPAALVALFSPGLKLAELIMPETHQSLAWTFGWFLRIAIFANAVFYYAIFSFTAYLLIRRSAK